MNHFCVTPLSLVSSAVVNFAYRYESVVKNKDAHKQQQRHLGDINEHSTIRLTEVLQQYD